LAQGRFTRIMVAVDGSAVSMRAVEQASRLARSDGAELLALHVVPSPQFEIPGELADYFDAARRNAERWFKEVDAAVALRGMTCRHEILVGAHSVVDAVLGYAENMGVDLIVTGTRGRSQTARLLMGSVASGLVEYASCTVLVVR
jgi:nucleotide-binding universal stress UspA family protein